MVIVGACLFFASQTVEVEDLSPSGLLLMRVFFHEIIAAGDDASFMEVRFWFCVVLQVCCRRRCVAVSFCHS